MLSRKRSQEIIRQLLRRFEHPKAGTWERIDLDIRRNRMGWGTIFLKDSAGKPLKNREIRFPRKGNE